MRWRAAHNRSHPGLASRSRECADRVAVKRTILRQLVANQERGADVSFEQRGGLGAQGPATERARLGLFC